MPKVFFYLLSPPAVRHQRTAYLSVTLMSSNRPGTVVNRHIKPQRTELSHMLLCRSPLRCSCDCHLLKLLMAFKSCYCDDQVVFSFNGGDIDGDHARSLTIELKECRRRMACPYRRVLCPPLCAACRDNSHAHKHAHRHVVTRQPELLTEQPQWSPSNCFNLHPTSGTEC